MRRKILVLALLFGVMMSLVAVDFMWAKKGDFYETVSNYLNISDGYEKTVIVIDAGHGGFDGGAVSKDGTSEEDITLAIAKELQSIASEYPIEIVMTREDDSALSKFEAENIISGHKKGKTKESDEDEPKETADKSSQNSSENKENFTGIKVTKKEDLNARKRVIDELKPVVAVSIHLNSFPDNKSVHGAQVFYPKNESRIKSKIMQNNRANSTNKEFFYAWDKQKRTDGLNVEQPSKIFAQSVQKSLENNISDGKERQALAKNDIVLFKETLYPTILVECGFLSNDEELERLKTAEYQRKLAESIWEGINEILCLEKSKNVQILDSTNKNK